MTNATDIMSFHSQHQFSRLPAELRWKIWALNLPGPRVVSIRCGSEPLSPARGPGRHSSLLSGCTSPAPIPVNLHVCHESRSEALRRYRPSFGIARQPGQIFFDPDEDVLYFGSRDGFMASEAQLRTVLMLCCPDELLRVRKVAINDALFWVYGNPSPVNPVSSPSCNDEYTTANNRHYHGRQQQRQWSGGVDSGGLVMHTAIATSLLADTLQLIRTRLPGLQELIFVPRDQNPLYSRDCCLVEPATMQSGMAQQIRQAMAIVSGSSSGGSSGRKPGSHSPLSAVPVRRQRQEQQVSQRQQAKRKGFHDDNYGVILPWAWKIMTLSANPDPPVYGRRGLAREEEEEQQPPSQGLLAEWEDEAGGRAFGRSHPNQKRKREDTLSAVCGVDGVPPEDASHQSSTKEWHRRRGGLGGEMTRSSVFQEGRRSRFTDIRRRVCV